MKWMQTGLIQLAVLCAAVAQIRAGTIYIGFEAFSDGENLHGVDLGGVTLTSRSGKVEVFDNRFGVSSHSPSKAIASLDGIVSVNPLVGVFDGPVRFVSLWAGDAGTHPEADSWELLAFDAPTGGNLLGQASSGAWNGSPYRQLTVTANDIWRFEANWTGPEFGIGYDDLEFEPGSSVIIPEPSTTMLLVMAVVGLLVFGQRRRKS
jgi:hypothetical protein